MKQHVLHKSLDDPTHVGEGLGDVARVLAGEFDDLSPVRSVRQR